MAFYGAVNNSDFLNFRKNEDYTEVGVCKRDQFQRDRDRIMHSRSFRRMMHKTQIFNANKGDHYRNRLTHTLEVSQIARSIGKPLGLNDELIEAIALGHDLGHTPFGHIGERTLHSILSNGIEGCIPASDRGFKHNYQTLQVVDNLESRCDDYKGLNLTIAVREGMLKHTSVKKGDVPYLYPELDLSSINMNMPSFTFEGQVVAVADEIAQCTHDLEDAVRSGIITFNMIRNDPFITSIIEESGIPANSFSETPTYDTRTLIIKNMVGFFIRNVYEESIHRVESYVAKYSPDYSAPQNCINEKCISLPPEIEIECERVYRDFIVGRVINSEMISISDAKSEYIIRQLFKAFYAHPKQLPDYVLERYYKGMGQKLDRTRIDDEVLQQDKAFCRTIADHIGGMTDQFAAREYLRLYQPEYK